MTKQEREHAEKFYDVDYPYYYPSDDTLDIEPYDDWETEYTTGR